MNTIWQYVILHSWRIVAYGFKKNVSTLQLFYKNSVLVHKTR